MTPPGRRKDAIVETEEEILRIVLATTKELQDVLACVAECNNISDAADLCKMLEDVNDKLQVIADNETAVINRMQSLLQRN